MSARPAVKLSRLLFATLLAVGVVLPQPVLARSADGALDMMDKDGDGRLSKDEWRKKKMFDQLDRDGDGYATREELQVFFGEEAGGGGATDTANAERPDEATMRAMLRDSRGDFDAARARGLVATGLHPVWPADVQCYEIDHYWAMDYTEMRGRQAAHGGIDIKAPSGEPVLAAMAGEVIAVYGGERNARGIEVVLRHGQDDSGIPYYLYSRYTHLSALPDLRVGQRVQMGDVLGATGNTGYFPSKVTNRLFGGAPGAGKSERYRLHFDVLYTQNPKYYDTGEEIVPFEAYYMDPNALYRKRPPFDSAAMRDLPETDKAIPISYRLRGGELMPADSKMIWPYECWK